MESLADRGFVKGSGKLSPGANKFLLAIPKNASSFLGTQADHNKWTSAIIGDSSNWDQVKEIIVVLRDPLERWVSGITQYLLTYIFYVHGPNTRYLGKESDPNFDYDFTIDDFIQQYNQLTERLIFDNLARFDDHVWPQHRFLTELPYGSIPKVYFYLDKNFNETISQYLNFNLIDVNLSNQNKIIKDIQEFIKGRLTLRPTLVSRIKHVYHNDYELINQVIK